MAAKNVDEKGFQRYKEASAQAMADAAKAKAERDAAPVVTQVTAAAPAPALEELTICPKCGADGDDPCLTKSGKQAKNRHKERP